MPTTGRTMNDHTGTATGENKIKRGRTVFFCPRCGQEFGDRSYSATRHIRRACWKACDNCVDKKHPHICDAFRKSGACTPCANRSLHCSRHDGPIAELEKGSRPATGLDSLPEKDCQSIRQTVGSRATASPPEFLVNRAQPSIAEEFVRQPTNDSPQHDAHTIPLDPLGTQYRGPGVSVDILSGTDTPSSHFNFSQSFVTREPSHFSLDSAEMHGSQRFPQNYGRQSPQVPYELRYPTQIYYQGTETSHGLYSSGRTGGLNTGRTPDLQESALLNHWGYSAPSRPHSYDEAFLAPQENGGIAPTATSVPAMNRWYHYAPYDELYSTMDLTAIETHDQSHALVPAALEPAPRQEVGPHLMAFPPEVDSDQTQQYNLSSQADRLGALLDTMTQDYGQQPHTQPLYATGPEIFHESAEWLGPGRLMSAIPGYTEAGLETHETEELHVTSTYAQL